MSRRIKIFIWLLTSLVAIGLAIFLLGPVLFASVAYPLPTKHQEAVCKYTKEYGISPSFLAALIMTESGWRENARSGAGAVGLTQFIPSTAVAVAKRLGVENFKVSDLSSNPTMAIRFGAYYISDGIRRNGGNKQLALIAYNGGQGAVLAYQRGYPVRGTVAYANKILAIEKMYERIYGDFCNKPDLPEFSARAKPNELITNIPVIDFWRTIVANPGTEAEKEETGSFNDFWQNLVPNP